MTTKIYMFFIFIDINDNHKRITLLHYEHFETSILRYALFTEMHLTAETGTTKYPFYIACPERRFSRLDLVMKLEQIASAFLKSEHCRNFTQQSTAT